MITRVVLFNWKPKYTKQEVEQLLNEIRALRDHIPGEFELRCGENIGGPPSGMDADGGYTHVVVATFKDVDTLTAYRAHPAHLLIAEKLTVMENQFLLFQIET